MALTPRYAAFALASAACGLIAGRASLGSPWTWGGLTMFAVLPFTAAVILPDQRRMLDAADPRDRALARTRWARLHAVRTGLGLAAAAAFLWATLQPVG